MDIENAPTPTIEVNLAEIQNHQKEWKSATRPIIIVNVVEVESRRIDVKNELNNVIFNRLTAYCWKKDFFLRIN